MWQRRIDIPRLDLIAGGTLPMKRAMAVYIGERPFILYNCAYMRNYILTANPANIPPKRQILSGELLIACYKKTIQKAIPWITAERYLNFTTDVTSKIRKERVQNLCVGNQEEWAYYMCSETINNPNESMKGRRTSDWTLKKIEKGGRNNQFSWNWYVQYNERYMEPDG